MIDSSGEEEKEIISLKVTLIGNTAVGKTALINQFVNNSYIDNPIATIGCDKFSKIERINNLKIKLNLWDTAGQERFRSLSPMFLKGSNIVILVYDITNQLSFDELRNYWVILVKENTNNIILGVAANKSDLYDVEIVDEENGRKFAEENNAFFYSTSSKNLTLTQNLFIGLTTLYIEKYANNLYNDDNSSSTSYKVSNDGKNVNSNCFC